MRTRKIKYAIEVEVELNSEMSDSQIDDYIEEQANGHDYIWCDADEELFDQ